MVNKKILFPIAKNKVVGVTKITNENFETVKEIIKNINNYYTMYIWTLTSDDYIVALNRSTNKDLIPDDDLEFFCFICYW